MTNNTFITVAVYQYSSEAQIIKGLLESEGIKVFLADHLTIDTDPLVSQAIGGVKLKVLAHEAYKAKEIINTIKRNSATDDTEVVCCPNCKSPHIELFSTLKDLKSLGRFIYGVLFCRLPFYTKHKYRCELCETEFDLTTKNPLKVVR